MLKKMFIVREKGETENLESFLIAVLAMGTFNNASIHNMQSTEGGGVDPLRIEDKETDLEDYQFNEEISVQHKWDGCTDIQLSEHFCVYGAAEIGKKLGLMIDAAIWLTQQTLIEYYVDFEGYTREGAKNWVADGSGPIDKPAIIYREIEYVEVEKEE